MVHSIVICTVGRASILDATVRDVAQQTPPAAEIILSCSAEDDVLASTGRLPGVRVVIGERGLPRQRNRGAVAARPDADLLTFLDDDVALRPDALTEAATLLRSRPDVVACSGTVLADGVKEGGIGRDQADAILLADLTAFPQPPQAFEEGAGLYGCNMHIRRPLLDQVRFDERLPGYAWLEDRDFSARASRHGHVGHFSGSRLVHLGTPSGRAPGRRLGYAQVVNPLYLWRHSGSVPGVDAVRLAARLTLRNAAGAFVDPVRRDRLIGNLRGLRDAVGGRLDPERMLDL